ncbi:alpha/beta hydrolase family protein [Terrarubrum flagellatum]|uniref:alpha/beta hydrolase family protein n=1 Tax=Terrirubrum flagellatum TaxID=2895980 RepID=UPI003144ED25
MLMMKFIRLAAIGVASACMISAAAGAEIKREEGVLPSRFPYMITMPDNWNGVLINDLDAVANKDGKFAAYLLEHGYAYTGTGRHPERMTRHDPLTELEAQAAVLKIAKEKYGKPKYTIQYGCSGGGFVTLAMAEKHADLIDGAIAFNARGTGGMAVANAWLDLPFALKALLAPGSSLLVAPVPNEALPAAYDAWKPVMEKAQQTPEGRARIALAVAVSQWPTWGAIANPPKEKPKGDLASLQAAMFRSASDGLNNATNRRQLYDNPAGLASWNTGIDYAKFYELGADPEQKAIVAKLYQEAGLGEAVISADLGKINAEPRIAGTPGGVRYWLEPGRLLDGKIGVPLLHAHGLGDALLPPHLLTGYAVAVEKQGKNELYRTAFVDAAGHCETEVSEAMAAIEAMVARLSTGKWGDTSPAALNAAARALKLAEPRFVSHTFRTPFNRAFYMDSNRPF